MGNLKDKISQLPFIKKLKSIKHLEIIVLIIFVGLLALILFSGDIGITKSSNSKPYTDYSSILETKLSEVLSNINGAGKVSVMVTVESSPKLIIATSTEQRKNTNESGNSSTDNTTIIETPVIISNNGSSGPLVLQEIQPKVSGVIVVAEGASDIKVRLELLKAVQSVLKVDISCIEIFVGK